MSNCLQPLVRYEDYPESGAILAQFFNPHFPAIWNSQFMLRLNKQEFQERLKTKELKKPLEARHKHPQGQEPMI